MAVDVTIGGTSPNFTVTVPSGRFTPPVTFRFTNSANATCWLWYSFGGAATMHVAITVGNYFDLPINANSDLKYNVTVPNASEPALSHIIHVGP
jgi:hypothetical protein